MLMWVKSDKRSWFSSRKPKMKCVSLLHRLLSIFLAVCSLLLTSSVCVASQVMQPRLGELWQCRVQHLRQYYSTKRLKQKAHPVFSCSVWYFPVLLIGWLVMMSFAVVGAFKLDNFTLGSCSETSTDITLDTLFQKTFKKDSVMLDLYVLIIIKLSVLFSLWRFAKTEAREHSYSRHNSSKFCYDDCYMCSHRWLTSSEVTTVTYWQEEPVTMVIPPLKHKCCHKRVVIYIVPNFSGPPRVIRQLLLLAGDVETNPGPETGDTKQKSCNPLDAPLERGDEAKIHKYLRELKKSEIVKVGVSLGVDYSKLSDVHPDEIHLKMINMWLSKQDYVSEISGTPTLRSLVVALRDNKLIGDAKKIEKDIIDTVKNVSTKETKKDFYSATAAENLAIESTSDSAVQGNEKEVKESCNFSARGSDSSSPCKCSSLHPEEPHKQFVAIMKFKTQKIINHYQEFIGHIKKSFLDQEKSNELFVSELKDAVNKAFEIEDIMPIAPDIKTRELLLNICQLQSYVNFMQLIGIISQCGNQEDKDAAEKYAKAYKQYAIERTLESNSEILGKELVGYHTSIFVLNNKQNFKLIDIDLFKCHLSDILNIKPHQLYLYRVDEGSIRIFFQVHPTFKKKLTTLLLFQNRMLFLKEQCCIQYGLEHRVFNLRNWNILNSVELNSNSLVSAGSAHVVQAKFDGKDYLAFKFTESFSDETTADAFYVNYLDIFMNEHFENFPNVKGLYYHQSLDDKLSYPVIVVEHMRSLKEVLLKNELSQISQLSLLLDILCFLSSFESKLQHLSILSDSVFIQESSSSENFTARFCPLYGHSFHSTQQLPCVPPSSPLPVEQLQWMSDVVKLAHFRGVTANDKELPDSHVFKKMLEQKWVSSEERFRPKDFKSLREELKLILETEKTFVGLVAVNSDDDIVEDEAQIHLILIGHTGVGKTSLRKHLKNEPIDMNQPPTIVMEPEFLYRESVDVDSTPFKSIGESLGGLKCEVLLTMWDTGGQPIFQDLLPCFARLKCLFGIVFRLTDLSDFDKRRADIRPCTDDYEMVTSPFTNKDILYRNLAYVQAFSSSLKKKFENLPNLGQYNSNSDSIFPGAAIIGTCKDSIDSSDQLWVQKKKELNIEIGKFVKSDMTVYSAANKDYFIHEVENKRSGNVSQVDPGITTLRTNITECARSLKTKIPSSWKVFEVRLKRLSYTSHVNLGIVPLDEVIALGRECNVSNPKAALMYFHELGVFMWYHMSERESMQQFVVIDPKVLLEALSKLLCYRANTSLNSKLISDKGIIDFDFFRTLLKQKASDIDDSWLISFLNEHFLINKITLPDQKSCFFFPSLLATKSDCNFRFISSENISPLYIVPQFGYVATGLFTRLLTALAGVTYGNTVWKISISGGCLSSASRNLFEFVVNECVYVVLSESSKYIKIDCVPHQDVQIEDDIYFYIAATLDKQLQRIVPKWIENRGFNFTFKCESKECESCDDHFLMSTSSLFENVESAAKLDCSKGIPSFLTSSQKKWFRSTPVTDNSALFEQCLKDGYLNLSVVSLMFVGPGTTSAKHVIFQQPIPNSSKPTPLVHHEFYFRAEGVQTIQKIELDSWNEIILHSFSEHETPDTLSESHLPEHKHSTQEASLTEHSFSARSLLNRFCCFSSRQSNHQEQESNITNSAVAYSQPSKHNDQPNDLVSTHELQNVHIIKEDTKRLILESMAADNFVKSMSNYKSRGKINFFNVFDCGSCFFEIREILKIFVSNISVCALCVDESQAKGNFVALQENQVFAKKGLVIGVLQDLDTPFEIQNESSQLKSDVIYLNCKDQSNTTGSQIINLSLSLVPPAKFPFSWYMFGFKVRRVMATLNRSTLSMSECMFIADELKMKRPEVEAALEHLTEHNILYYSHKLSDVVFSSINVFSNIFSELYRNVSNHTTMTKQDICKAITPNEIVSADSFIHLFQKLAIIAPHGENNFILPCFLPILNKVEVKRFHTGQYTLLIKCPSSGYEFICLLTAYLISQPTGNWRVLTNAAGELCLHKNAVKYYVRDSGEVYISFCDEYLKVSCSESSVRLENVSSVIMHGLEKIKFILRCYRNFDFHLSFICECGVFRKEHTCSYDSKTNTLTCDENKAVARMQPNMYQWVHKPALTKNREFVTVRNVVKRLEGLSKEWIRIATLLKLPTSVISTINAISSHQPDMGDEGALRKVIEWWFLNTANPEWSTIEDIVNPPKKGSDVSDVSNEAE